MEFKKGDIIWGRKKPDARHPIVFYENINNENFLGFMLSKESYDNENKLVKEEFIKKQVEGINKPFQWNNTHIVPAALKKPWEWAPFIKAGEFTD